MNQEANPFFLLAILPFCCPFSLLSLLQFLQPYTQKIPQIKELSISEKFLGSFLQFSLPGERMAHGGCPCDGVLCSVWGGNSPCPLGFSGNRQRMLTSPGVCKAPGLEFRYESSTSPGANQERVGDGQRQCCCCSPTWLWGCSNSSSTHAFVSPLILGVNYRGRSLWGADGLRCVHKQSAARKINQ